MTKKLLRQALMFCCLLWASGLMAQFALGPKLGVSIANVSGDGEIDFKSVTNLQIGLVAELGGSAFAIQPEITYIGRGTEASSPFGTSTSTVAYFDIGALAKIKFGALEGFGGYIGAGPFFNYALSGTIDDGSGDVDIDFDADGYNRTDFSVAGAVGVTYNTGLIWFLDIRYILGLNKVVESDLLDLNWKNRTLGLTVGVLAPL